MLVCKKQKVIFVDIPKTASRSIYSVLLKNYKATKLRTHAITIPAEYKDYFSFCVVRNPYDRACSLYWHICRRAGIQQPYRDILTKKGLENNLINFLTIIRKQKQNIHLPQHRFYEGNNITQILRFETLQKDWDTLPFLIKPTLLPHLNATQGVNSPGKSRPHWRELVDKESSKLIHDLFEKDFELFNYEMGEV